MRMNWKSVPWIISVIATGVALHSYQRPLPPPPPLPSIALAEASDAGPNFVELAKKVVPSVVNISTFTYSAGVQNYASQDEIFRRFFQEFFGDSGGPDSGGGPFMPPAQRQKPQQKIRRPQALGSGFIISEEGHILTNQHVVGDAEEIKVKFTEDPKEKQVDAVVIGRDPELDLALIKVNVKKKLIPLSLGNSDQSQVGEYVVAVGNPFGQGHSVTHGIISAKGREAPGLLAKYIQTDAPINPGNSGGPLINLRGEVIGINNAIDARAQGIGFAIPSNMAKSVLPQLKANGTVERGYIGVNVSDLTPSIAKEVKAPKDLEAPFVINVQEGEPADRAGIKPYDVIIEVNGEKIAQAFDLTRAVTAVPVGGKASIKVLRSGKEKVFQVQVAKRPDFRTASSGRPANKKKGAKSQIETGLILQNLSDEIARRLGIPKNQKGVVVEGVEQGSRADASGLIAGDVIVEIDRTPVVSINDFNKIVNKTKSYLLRVLRVSPRVGEPIFLVLVLDLKGEVQESDE